MRRTVELGDFESAGGADAHHGLEAGGAGEHRGKLGVQLWWVGWVEKRRFE